MITLLDLISLENKNFLVNPNDFKAHLAMFSVNSNSSPLLAFFEGKFKQWQEHQSRKNFERSYILSLIQLEPNKTLWLFSGVYRVLGCEEIVPSSNEWRSVIRYRTDEIIGLEDLVGRVVIEYNKSARQCYRDLEKIMDDLNVYEILSKKKTIQEFDGYHSILLPYRILKSIVQNELISWCTALSNVNGIYIIVDIKTGKQYVGSAYGDKGIWQRWIDYVKTGHGGNDQLKQLLRYEGDDYVENFQFSILEVCDIHADKDYIFDRETHWKNVLCSRTFGYNKN